MPEKNSWPELVRVGLPFGPSQSAPLWRRRRACAAWDNGRRSASLPSPRQAVDHLPMADAGGPEGRAGKGGAGGRGAGGGARLSHPPGGVCSTRSPACLPQPWPPAASQPGSGQAGQLAAWTSCTKQCCCLRWPCRLPFHGQAPDCMHPPRNPHPPTPTPSGPCLPAAGFHGDHGLPHRQDPGVLRRADGAGGDAAARRMSAWRGEIAGLSRWPQPHARAPRCAAAHYSERTHLTPCMLYTKPDPFCSCPCTGCPLCAPFPLLLSLPSARPACNNFVLAVLSSALPSALHEPSSSFTSRRRWAVTSGE